MLRKNLFVAAALVVAISAFQIPFQAKAFQLLSHRAVYDLSLMPGGEGAVSNAEGRLVIEWADTCDGYTTEQRMLMRLGLGSRVVGSDFQFSSWESKDGDQFRYDVKSSFADEKPEVFQGRAKRQGDTAIATFTKPANLKLELPQKIVFPSEQMARMIDNAANGKRRIAMPMFDGTGEKGLIEAVAFVLGPAPKSSSRLLDGVTDVPGWRFQLSFFDLNSRDQLPIYKVVLTLFSNGVAGDLVMSYPEFSVRGKLSAFKILPSTGC